MKKPFRKLYIKDRFYHTAIVLIALLCLSFFMPFLTTISWLLLTTLAFLLLLDILLLFSNSNGIVAKRILTEKLSNGDDNPIVIEMTNRYQIKIFTEIIDEIPFQFQERHFLLNKNINSGDTIGVQYQLRPTERGEYFFGKLNIYAKTMLGLVSKRYVFDDNKMVPTYPSFIQLKKYDLMAFSNHLFQYGIKKIRRIGHTMEFEQIKEYVTGDDIRTLNWKATAKKNQLMVNQFQDEKSQNVYMVIDKGRVMKMPFEGLSLLDYAINATLVLSNVITKKHDKAGMFTFSKKIENRVVADRRSGQMQLLMEALYNIKTNYFESDFSRLYVDIKRNIKQRSLIILYTNFETIDGLHRQLPYLKGIAKSHLLVVVFFKNTELNHMIEQEPQNVQEIYDQVIAEKFMFEKKMIVQELKKYGIYSLLTEPEHLTLNSINKYLEIKARGIL